MRFEVMQGEWFRLVMGSLASSGVTDAVASPGSRSAPLVVAAAEEPRIHVFAAYDERSAAFMALGLARASGRPTVLIRTSGTATAHDFPAVIEASEDCVPLLILSADRPFELQAAAAPQTTDQRHLFGRFVRADFELGLPNENGLSGAARSAARAVFATIHPVPGPVHVNCRMRKPLEPRPPEAADERSLQERVTELIASPRRQVGTRPRFGSAALASVVDDLTAARAGVIVAGPLPPPPRGEDLVNAVGEFVERSGFTLVAETTSQLRRPDLNPADDFDWTPPHADVAVLLGRYPSSRNLQGVLRSAQVVLSVDPHRPADPDGRAAASFHGPIETWLRIAAAAFAGKRPPQARRPPRWPAVTKGLDATDFCEAHAVRTVADALSPGTSLVLGNSLPIRLFDRFVPASELPTGRIFHQRGVNGIDGLVSGAVGVAHETDGPTVAVLGDLSFLHDLNGMALARSLERPLVVVVLNNRGGRIFEELPLADKAGAEVMALFTTPHAFDLTAAGRLYDVPAAAVDDAASLARELSQAIGRKGASLIEVRCPPGRLAVAHRSILGVL